MKACPNAFGTQEAAFLQLANGGLKVKVWDKVVGDAEIRYLGASQFDIEALYKIKHYQLVAVRFVVEISGTRHSNISFIRAFKAKFKKHKRHKVQNICVYYTINSV